MTKRKSSQTRAKRQAQLISWISYLAIALIIAVASVGAGYYFGFKDGHEKAESAYAKERESTQKIIAELKRATMQQATPQLKKRLQGVLERDQKKYTAAHEYSDPSVVEKPVERPVKHTTALPKLAIIVDDVAFAHDVRNIKALGLPLTMSFLPPSPIHPDSAKLASKEPYYMVHLPLEAKNFSAEEPETLRVNQSQSEISRRIRNIKQLFPKVEFINNHTGSTFTSDERAMNRLIYALRKHRIGFIDSRTTAETKVPKVLKNYGMAYMARDVFLDHDPDIAAIKKQIRHAIEVAKKHGSAIAICHPHKNTLEALRQSKQLLKEVQLVRMDRYI